MEPLALLNGQLLPQSQATLALNDAGFVFGATVTDLARTIRQRLYRWPDHLTRFRRGCTAIALEPPDDAQITAWAEELVAHNARLLGPGQELALVVFATPGPIGYYLGAPGGIGDAPPTFGMHTFPLPLPRYRPLIQHGATLVIPPTRQVPSASVPRSIKQRSRLHWWRAEIEARQLRPGAMALLLDETGTLTETAAANFLLVRAGTVLSPPADRILAGVSLDVVIELCQRLGIPFAHQPLTPADCATADEALLTSTPYGLVGVRAIDGTHLPCPGPLTRRLRQAWTDDVGLDLHRQILGT